MSCKTYGETIAKLLKDKKITGRELSRRMGVSVQTISTFLHAPGLNASTLERICRAAELDPAAILFPDGAPWIRREVSPDADPEPAASAAAHQEPAPPRSPWLDFSGLPGFQTMRPASSLDDDQHPRP